MIIKRKKMIGVEEALKKFSQLNSLERHLIYEISKRKLTYLPGIRLISIVNTCRQIISSNIKGVFIEAGCALGGSTILISKIKEYSRQFNVYDAFDIIPPPSQEDSPSVHNRYKRIIEGNSPGILGNKYYGYEDNLFEVVLRNLEQFGVDCKKDSLSLIKGLLQDTMVINGPVAFAHIDVDWYEPVKTSLKRIFPKLSVGGSIIVDDYHDWSGCRKATDEYLDKVQGQFTVDDSFESLKITRIK